jgi:hypothetical protein
MLAEIGAGLSGLAQLGYATGLFKSPEQKAQEAADNRRKAQLAYLQTNMPDFSYTAKEFNPDDYKDVLQPMEERLSNEQEGMGNRQSLQGTGRGGVSQELMLQAARQGNADIGNKETELARTEEQKAFDRAMAIYNAKLGKVQAMAQYQ